MVTDRHLTVARSATAETEFQGRCLNHSATLPNSQGSYLNGSAARHKPNLAPDRSAKDEGYNRRRCEGCGGCECIERPSRYCQIQAQEACGSHALNQAAVVEECPGHKTMAGAFLLADRREHQIINTEQVRSGPPSEDDIGADQRRPPPRSSGRTILNRASARLVAICQKLDCPCLRRAGAYVAWITRLRGGTLLPFS